MHVIFVYRPTRTFVGISMSILCTLYLYRPTRTVVGISMCLYDIICVTETWLSDYYPDSLFTNGLPYQVFRHDRLTRGGGCAIFVNSNFSSSRLKLPIDLGDLEVIAIEIYTCAQPLVICCIYNSSGHNRE